MPHIPSLRYTVIIKFLQSREYKIARQKGSHIRLLHPHKIPITVPAHDPVSRGVLRKILRDTSESVESLNIFLRLR